MAPGLVVGQASARAPAGPWCVDGLHLPDGVLMKVDQSNAVSCARLARCDRAKNPWHLALDSRRRYDGFMKTSVDIPDEELADAMRFTKARTKREAIVTAITEFNARRRMTELARYAGTSDQFMTVAQLQAHRQQV